MNSPPKNWTRFWPSRPVTATAWVSITATSSVTARSRSRTLSGSFMWYRTPRYKAMSNRPTSSRSTVAKSATIGSTLDARACLAKSKAVRPGSSGSQKSVVSRPWSGRTPRSSHSAQYRWRAAMSTPQT